jgi:ubiquinone/menaquinone biosynthesis C-methylase UbiE
LAESLSANRVNLQEKYDHWHEEISQCERVTGELTHPWHRTVARLLPELSRSRVLEIGCGRGDFARWILRQFPGVSITAVDFSAVAIDLARSRAASAGDAVCFDVMDAQSLSFENEVFDVVVSCECLEHVPRPERMTREIHRVLKAGGKYLLTTENYCNGMLLAWINSWLRGAPFNSGSGIQPHENLFFFWKVKRLLKQSGLVVNHMESNHFQWLLLPRVDPAKLCTLEVRNPLLKRLCRPFGRHFTFCGVRPT